MIQRQIIENELELEYQFFRLCTFLSIAVASILFFFDTFLSKDYNATIIEVFGIFIFSSFYFIVEKYNVFRQIMLLYCVFLFILGNIIWYFSGGAISSNVLIFTLFNIVISFILPRKLRWSYFFVLILNILFILIYEYYHPEIRSDKLSFEFIITTNITLLLTLPIGVYLIFFAKEKYEEERKKLKVTYQKLDDKKNEIEIQNNELINKTNEIEKQKTNIERINRALNNKNNELVQAMNTIQKLNDNLENIIEDRTKEISSLYKDMDLLFYKSAHDFRSPIATLLGLSNLAKLTTKDQEHIHLWQQVTKTSENMGRMFHKFSMLSEINHFSSSSKKSDFPISFIIDQLIHDYQKKYPEINFIYSIDLNYYDDNDSRNKIINIILDSLLENATTFHRKEGNIPTVKMDIKEISNHLEISVNDNGLGIDFNLIDKIFDLYFRGNEKSNGNGLGLYVVKHAVKKLSGSIEVDSQLNQYTHFKITIPVHHTLI